MFRKIGIIVFIALAIMTLVLTVLSHMEGTDSGLYFKRDKKGVVITGVVPSSQWYKAGFRKGDLILGFDGSSKDIFLRLTAYKMVQRPGRGVGFALLKSNGVELDLTFSPTRVRSFSNIDLSILLEAFVKVVFCFFAAFYFLFYTSEDKFAFYSGAMFLSFAMFSPFYLLNMNYVCLGMGWFVAVVVLAVMLVVCFFPYILAQLCRTFAGTIKEKFFNDFISKVMFVPLLFLYISYMFISIKFISALCSGASIDEIAFVLKAYPFLNGVLLFLLGLYAAGGLFALASSLSSTRRKRYSLNAVFVAMLAGLALPLIIGVVLRAFDLQYTVWYGLRKLLYLLFPLLYMKAMRKEDLERKKEVSNAFR